MARYVPEGTVEVTFAVTASLTAPTAAHGNGGTDITEFLVGDIDLPFEGDAVDAADLSSKFNKTAAGDYGGQPGSFTIHRELANGDDTAYTTLTRGTAGYLMIAERGLATAGTWAINDYVSVWPIEVLSRATVWGRNQTLRAAIRVAITDVPLENYKILS